MVSAGNKVNMAVNSMSILPCDISAMVAEIRAQRSMLSITQENVGRYESHYPESHYSSSGAPGSGSAYLLLPPSLSSNRFI